MAIGEMPNVDGSVPCIVVPNHGSYTKGVAYATTFTGMTAIIGGQEQTVKVANVNSVGYTDTVYGYGIKFGEDKPHNNVQPYLSVYLWKRTA